MNRKQYLALKEGMSVLSGFYSKKSINAIPLDLNTSEAHWWAVARLSRELKVQGCVVVCEAEFKHNRGRADIYLPELVTAIEVMHTEDKESIEAKMAKYPCRVGWITTEEAETNTPDGAVQLALTRANYIREDRR